MSYMEHSTASRSASNSRLTQAARTGTDEQTRDLPHFRSLITPGLATGPILPERLRAPFRHKGTIETKTAERTPGDLNFEPLITPGLFKGPILPERLRGLFQRKDTPASR